MIASFEGIGVALITPFNDDLSIDFNSLEKIINHTISGGVDYLVALGTTGEPATLTKQEKQDVLAFCKKKIDGRLPLVVGAGGNNTAQVISDIKELDMKGVAGLLSVAPYYNKPSQEGLYQHFKAIANSTNLPVIIYNVPGRTSSNISAEIVVKLAENCNNIVALKEASGDFNQIMQIIKNKPASFTLLSADDAITLPMISLGARGVISVVANSHPLEYCNLVRAALNGDYDKAKENQYKLIDYINALFTEGSPSGLKSAMEIMGLCKKHVRLPLVPVSEVHYLYLQKLISEI